MSLLDRVVLYGGVLLAVVLAAISFYNSRKSASEFGSLQTEAAKLQAELLKAKKAIANLTPTTVEITVTPHDCPKGVAGSCCTQDAKPWGVNKQGNPYVNTGDFVSWTFDTPKVDVAFDKDDSPFPSDYEYKSDDSHETSKQQVKLAGTNYNWGYKALAWGNKSCQHVVEPTQGATAPPGIVMRPPPSDVIE